MESGNQINYEIEILKKNSLLEKKRIYPKFLVLFEKKLAVNYKIL